MLHILKWYLINHLLSLLSFSLSPTFSKPLPSVFIRTPTLLYLTCNNPTQHNTTPFSLPTYLNLIHTSSPNTPLFFGLREVVSSMDEKGRRTTNTLLSEDEMDLRRGPWTVDEDLTLINYIATHGEGRWNTLALSAGIYISSLFLYIYISLLIHSNFCFSIFLCHSGVMSPLILPFNCLQWIWGSQSSIFLWVRISL